MITFGAGARVEHKTEYPAGIAHYMEHVRFKGTDERSAKDLLRITADAGGSWNAFTSNNLVVYYMSIPEENLETAFDCLSDVVLRPAFPQDELTKEQNVVCQEIRMYDDQIDHLVDKRLNELVFNNSMAVPIMGSEESVRSITQQHLIDFNKEFYSKEHMLVTLGANGDHEHLVEKYFGIPDDILLFAPEEQNVHYNDPVDDKVYKEAQLQDSILICFGGQSIRELESKHRAATKVFSTIFDNEQTSRLWMKIREDLGLVYDIGGYLSHQMDGSIYEIYASTEPKNTNLLIESVNKEIENILRSNPTEREVSRAKNMIKSRFYGSLDSSDGVVQQVLGEEFMNFATASEFLAEIKQVTADDVNKIAKKIFNNNRYTVIGTGK